MSFPVIHISVCESFDWGFGPPASPESASVGRWRAGIADFGFVRFKRRDPQTFAYFNLLLSAFPTIKNPKSKVFLIHI